MLRNMERRFVQFKRVGNSWPEKALGRIDEMPEKDWNRFQNKIFERKKYEFIRIIDLEERGVVSVSSGGLPVIDDELECPLCGFIAGSEGKLVDHKNKIHG